MKRSILGLLYIIQGMRKAGVDVDERLQGIGIHAEALDPAAVIHPELEKDVFRVIGESVAAEAGLEIGQHYALAGYGPLLMLLVTSDNIATVLKKGIEYQGLTHLTGHLSLKRSAHAVALCYQPEDLLSPLGQLRAQCEISGTYKFVQDIYRMMGLARPDLKVELPFAQSENPDIQKMYRDYYGPQLQYSSTSAAFWFDEAVLDIRIPSEDAVTFALYEAKCLAEVQRLHEDENTPTVVQRVQDYLELQNGMMPTMAETAQALSIPERTLRHQLQQVGTSYKQIREEIIKDKALRLIEYKQYSIEMIAELLGYSEPAAFNHAFKRWFGQSPRQYVK
ncbi:AraC family transcriptional regulator [Acinetobacter sp. RF14B]|uniref:AraC family transcriptional regulator n=1 Tax=Acinetobacter sp. RF14B TaxID=2650965 RepID=UPI00116E0A4F|nr:AraC family transcriptional regulator [Acinetobacter sp. RF14B]TQR61867.1 AraC family transcriptional regulator [Acinetobacter sp. RF14B]